MVFDPKLEVRGSTLSKGAHASLLGDKAARLTVSMSLSVYSFPSLCA